MKEEARTVAELVSEIFNRCEADSVVVRGLILRDVCDLESGVLEEDHELGWWRCTFPDSSRLAGNEEGFGVAL